MSIAPSPDRPYFAAFLNLKDKPGVVVGGGPVAALKAETLLRSGVKMTVVAPELCPRLAELTVLGALRHEPRRFQAGDLVGAESPSRRPTTRRSTRQWRQRRAPCGSP